LADISLDRSSLLVATYSSNPQTRSNAENNVFGQSAGVVIWSKTIQHNCSRKTTCIDRIFCNNKFIGL